MFQTSFRGITALHNNRQYAGGFCKFFYIPIEDIDVFPRVSPETQGVVDQPSLKAGKSWYGPIDVPRDKLGFQENAKESNAGPYYEIILTGVNNGESEDSRVNIENMRYHRFLVAGQLRAGGLWLLIGTPDSWCKFTPQFTSGVGPAETAMTQISFSNEQIHKALLLPDFITDSTPPADPGGGEEEISMANNKEILPFESKGTIVIPWTAGRQSRFGNYPMIQVWLNDGGQYYKDYAAEIFPDQPAPGFTELTIRVAGPVDGFIVLT